MTLSENEWRVDGPTQKAMAFLETALKAKKSIVGALQIVAENNLEVRCCPVNSPYPSENLFLVNAYDDGLILKQAGDEIQKREVNLYFAVPYQSPVTVCFVHPTGRYQGDKNPFGKLK